MGLIKSGCPKDEYSSEVVELCAKLKSLKHLSANAVVKTLVEVFDGHFLKGSTEISSCYRISEELVGITQSYAEKS